MLTAWEEFMMKSLERLEIQARLVARELERANIRLLAIQHLLDRAADDDD